MRGTRPMRSVRFQNLEPSLPRWWSIANRQDGPTMVSIYDEIGMMGVSARQFLNELSGIDGDITLHLNSPGGDVFDAIAIYNSLRARKGTVAVVVDGLAASAASFIAQAASPGHLEMAQFSSMMIHDGFAAGIGNAADMRGLADQLDAASDTIAAIYAARTGKPAEYWRDKMRATTWYKDSEAVADGLADRVRGQDGDTGTVGNAWDLSVFNADGTKRKPPVKPAPNGPDGYGDDDSTPEGDTDHDEWAEDGKAAPKQKKAKGLGGKTAALHAPKVLAAGSVDSSPWDADKAWHNGASSDNPAAFYKAITVGRRDGDPAKQSSWALPYRYTPGSAPNAAAVRNALARLSSTEGLTNREQAQAKLERLMKKINPDYDASSNSDCPGWLRNISDQAPAWLNNAEEAK